MGLIFYFDTIVPFERFFVPFEEFLYPYILMVFSQSNDNEYLGIYFFYPEHNARLKMFESRIHS